MAKAVAFFRIFWLDLKIRAIRASFPNLALRRVLDVHGSKFPPRADQPRAEKMKSEK